MDVLKFSVIPHNGAIYWSAVNLRSDVLRKPLGLEFTKEELLLENDQVHIVAILNEKLVACLSLVKVSDSTLKMRQVAVNTELQGQRIGAKLVAFSETWAKENGYHEMVLHAREAASKFYTKLKYNVVGDTFLEVGLPHYEMKKRLC